MGAFLAMAIANPELSVPLVLAAMDILGGWLPDRFTKWPGLILSGAVKAYNYGKDFAPLVTEIETFQANPPDAAATLSAILLDPQKVAELYKALAVHQRELRNQNAD